MPDMNILIWLLEQGRTYRRIAAERTQPVIVSVPPAKRVLLGNTSASRAMERRPQVRHAVLHVMYAKWVSTLLGVTGRVLMLVTAHVQLVQTVHLSSNVQKDRVMVKVMHLTADVSLVLLVEKGRMFPEEVVHHVPVHRVTNVQ